MEIQERTKTKETTRRWCQRASSPSSRRSCSSQALGNHLYAEHLTQSNYNSFPVQKNMIEKLCDEVIKILDNTETVVKVRPPAKIFGNIHGVYGDLMRFFGTHGRDLVADFRRTYGAHRTKQ